MTDVLLSQRARHAVEALEGDDQDAVLHVLADDIEALWAAAERFDVDGRTYGRARLPAGLEVVMRPLDPEQDGEDGFLIVSVGRERS